RSVGNIVDKVKYMLGHPADCNWKHGQPPAAEPSQQVALGVRGSGMSLDCQVESPRDQQPLFGVRSTAEGGAKERSDFAKAGAKAVRSHDRTENRSSSRTFEWAGYPDEVIGCIDPAGPWHHAGSEEQQPRASGLSGRLF